jgi:hypothetical protein
MVPTVPLDQRPRVEIFSFTGVTRQRRVADLPFSSAWSSAPVAITFGSCSDPEAQRPREPLIGSAEGRNA